MIRSAPRVGERKIFGEHQKTLAKGIGCDYSSRPFAGPVGWDGLEEGDLLVVVGGSAVKKFRTEVLTDR